MFMQNEKRFNEFSRIASLCLFICGLLVLTTCAPKIDSFDPKQGKEGTEVTIKGKRFKDMPADNTVKFGDVEVPTTDITYSSTTMVKAKVPSDAKTARISISNSKGTGYSTEKFIVTDSDSAEWTFMVFLNSDNNLEPAGIDDFMEMASVGSSERVKIVVQMDRCHGYTNVYGDWAGTKRFLIELEDTPSVTPIADLGEQNMGDPDVLQDFVEWAITTFPAKHYALSIWDHGDGWRILRDRLIMSVTSEDAGSNAGWGVSKVVSQDETNDNDVLYMKEVQNALETALSNIESQLGKPVKFDVLGFDACLMGMVEVAYAMRNVANYLVGSEYLEPSDGWSYDSILNELASDPLLHPQQVADLIVSKYVDAYSDRHGITQSSVDIAKLNNLCTKIDNFVSVATTEWSALKIARTNTLEYHLSGASVWGVDLWHFTDNVYNQVTSTEIKTAALQLKNAIEDFVSEEGHSTDMDGSYGISIYFPPDRAAYNNDPEHTGYEESNTVYPVDFISDYHWDNWLQTFYSNI